MKLRFPTSFRRIPVRTAAYLRVKRTSPLIDTRYHLPYWFLISHRNQYRETRLNPCPSMWQSRQNGVSFENHSLCRWTSSGSKRLEGWTLPRPATRGASRELSDTPRNLPFPTVIFDRPAAQMPESTRMMSAPLTKFLPKTPHPFNVKTAHWIPSHWVRIGTTRQSS